MHLQSQNGRSDLRITSGKEQLMAVFCTLTFTEVQRAAVLGY